jgi:hypothetical protein
MKQLRWRSVCVALIGLGLLTMLVPPISRAADIAPDQQGWVEIDYGPLIERRQLTHSGDSVGTLLDRAATGQAADRLSLSLLDPLLEPYALVLPDTVDSFRPLTGAPFVEIGHLWQPGEQQPAWVELLRARHLLVESDGNGRMRFFLPWTVADGDTASRPASQRAAETAWQSSWSILRHVLAAERSRLDAVAIASEEAVPIVIEVYAYTHSAARSRFGLGLLPFTATIDDLRSRGDRPPLDLAAWQAFLDEGLQLEGGILEEDGSIRLLGSKVATPPRLIGEPLTLADFAVAYRAVFYGGLAEPYMSLDRGYSPQSSLVNYGGRLRDTRLGLVTLLCDIRFKTFSLGLDIISGRDLRDELRRVLPDFRSHIERFALDKESQGVMSQQTRLWFYPDDVDLTIAPQADVLAMRRVRMTAASERVQAAGTAGQDDPPWTRQTIQAINGDYDGLSEFFPELADLDQVVRLLSFFTWLKHADGAGLRLPDLHDLLAIELPQLTTPKRFPQLLAFNALPASGSPQKAEVFDRVPVAEALDRLGAAGDRPLTALRRFDRALASLDPRDPGSARLLKELQGYASANLDDSALDMMAYKAERIRMHRTVLSTLALADQRTVVGRQQAGETLRIFSVGIGGLDLGMGKAVTRAGARSFSLAASGTSRREAPEGASSPRVNTVSARPIHDEWRRHPVVDDTRTMPAHGMGAIPAVPGGRADFVDGWIELSTPPADGELAERSTWVETLVGRDGPDLRGRRLYVDQQGKAEVIVRLEASRYLSYRLEGQGTVVHAVLEETVARDVPPPAGVTALLPNGLATLTISPTSAPTKLNLSLESTVLLERKRLGTDVPRVLLQRLVLGHAADRTPGTPLPALSPLPGQLGQPETLMVLSRSLTSDRAWAGSTDGVPGEEDAWVLGRTLNAWWREDASASGMGAVVGVDPGRSPGRWAAAPSIEGLPVLLLPEAAFSGSSAALREELAASWKTGDVVDSLPAASTSPVVILISAEPVGLCASRVRELAVSPALKDRYLAVWCLSGRLREEFPRAVLEAGNLAALGVAENSVVGLREAPAQIAELGSVFGDSDRPARVEHLPGPFFWFY